jgi:predicted nucleic acid-binding protein
LGGTEVIVVDTGPIVAAAIESDDAHTRCLEMLLDARRRGERLLMPMTVAAEAGYLIDSSGGPHREAAFLAGIAGGDFEPVELTRADFQRMAGLVEQYADMRLGTTDASVIVVAERFKVSEVATLNHRHFTVVRPAHTGYFQLLP